MDQATQPEKSLSFDDLAPAERELVLAAQQASGNAYAPYSGFAVGAAVRCGDGRIYVGANLENASYGVAVCAEVTAIANANAADDYDVVALAVVAHKFSEPSDVSLVAMPCGRCRQLISEAGQISATDVQILSCNGDLTQIRASTISRLLPSEFGPKNLGLSEEWPKMRRELKLRLAELQENTRRKSP